MYTCTQYFTCVSLFFYDSGYRCPTFNKTSGHTGVTQIFLPTTYFWLKKNWSHLIPQLASFLIFHQAKAKRPKQPRNNENDPWDFKARGTPAVSCIDKNLLPRLNFAEFPQSVRHSNRQTDKKQYILNLIMKKDKCNTRYCNKQCDCKTRESNDIYQTSTAKNGMWNECMVMPKVLPWQLTNSNKPHHSQAMETN